jgi:hypothetical protein
MCRSRNLDGRIKQSDADMEISANWECFGLLCACGYSLDWHLGAWSILKFHPPPKLRDLESQIV